MVSSVAELSLETVSEDPTAKEDKYVLYIYNY